MFVLREFLTSRFEDRVLALAGHPVFKLVTLDNQLVAITFFFCPLERPWFLLKRARRSIVGEFIATWPWVLRYQLRREANIATSRSCEGIFENFHPVEWSHQQAIGNPYSVLMFSFPFLPSFFQGLSSDLSTGVFWFSWFSCSWCSSGSFSTMARRSPRPVKTSWTLQNCNKKLWQNCLKKSHLLTGKEDHAAKISIQYWLVLELNYLHLTQSKDQVTLN